MDSVSAAVTVFGRQAGISVDVTQTKSIRLQMPPPCLCHRAGESGKVLRNATNSLLEPLMSKHPVR